MITLRGCAVFGVIMIFWLDGVSGFDSRGYPVLFRWRLLEMWAYERINVNIVLRTDILLKTGFPFDDRSILLNTWSTDTTKSTCKDSEKKKGTLYTRRSRMHDTTCHAARA